MNDARQSGFSAIELLVAIIIAALMFGAAYQLYGVSLRNAASSQSRARASNIAYDVARQYQERATNPCTTLTETPTPSDMRGLVGATVSAIITCPYGTTSDISLVTTKVTYSDPALTEVTHALYTIK